MSAVAQAREQLQAWRRDRCLNYFESDVLLQGALRWAWGPERYAAQEPGLSTFGEAAAGPIDEWTATANHPANLPRLEVWDDLGERLEEVVHHPSHHLAGRAIYGTGIMAAHGEAGGNLKALALMYLSSHNGEGGHNCPLAMTGGLIRALRALGSRAQQARYLPRLTDPNYDRRHSGGQLLTEVQGGSDVGANACQARPDESQPGAWLLEGEKWFTSNAGADLFLATARPQGAPAGTKGLGLFLLPRRLEDGRLNGIHLRRLKDKLGTRSLPTGEMDFREAWAEQLGPLERGFQHVMELVIHTSRLYNALAVSGMARRACLEAGAYARHRRAFGRPIIEFPLVREALAQMRAQTQGMVAASLLLAHTEDLLELDTPWDGERDFQRLAVNINKYCTAVSAHEVILRGLELFGGNGTIETFSILPRLLRDNVVCENWEGTHNTLIAQVLRDMHRYEMHRGFFEGLRLALRGAEQAGLEADLLRPAFEALASLERGARGVLELDEAQAGPAMRGLADRLGQTLQVAALLNHIGVCRRLGLGAHLEGASAAARLLGRRYLGWREDLPVALPEAWTRALTE